MPTQFGIKKKWLMLKTDTIQIQEALGSYCKTGETPQLPGVVESRLPQYRRLVRNVFYGILQQAFPITSAILTDEEWDQLINDFMVHHPAQEHEVWKMPKELVDFVEGTDYSEKLNRPYLEELLHFEWIEILVHGMEDVPFQYTPSQQLSLTDKVMLNPYHELVTLQYPVHKSAETDYNQHKGVYYVLVHRDIEEFDVQFTELAPFVALLINAIENDNSHSFSQILDQVCQEVNIERSAAVEQQAEAFLNHFLQKKVLFKQ